MGLIGEDGDEVLAMDFERSHGDDSVARHQNLVCQIAVIRNLLFDGAQIVLSREKLIHFYSRLRRLLSDQKI